MKPGLALAQIQLISSNSSVYEPSDDSFALVDALAESISSSKVRPSVCLELGSGSGYVICSIALLLQQQNVSCHCIAVDINPAASSCTAASLAAHKIGRIDTLTCDLVGPLFQQISGKVDLLVFNPPYVPTPAEEVERSGIARAWAGGMRGRAVIDRILPQVESLLSPDGSFFMVAVAENDPEEICHRLESCGLKASIVLRRRADEEFLSIILASRQPIVA